MDYRERCFLLYTQIDLIGHCFDELSKTLHVYCERIDNEDEASWHGLYLQTLGRFDDLMGKMDQFITKI